MGGPFSSLMTDIYLDNFENKVLHLSEIGHRVAVWLRFVDYVFCIWTGSDVELQHFQDELDAVHISFTFTTDCGGSATNFLDLTIHIQQDNFFTYTTYEVHQKPTFSGVLINTESRFTGAINLQSSMPPSIGL